jgi:hypothetical protein
MSTTPVTNNGLGMMAATPMIGNGKSNDTSDGNWFEALSQAWGKTLDNEASRISAMSDGLSAGNENPSDITKLTAESMRMSFLSQSSSSSIDSVGKSLETMARKG